MMRSVLHLALLGGAAVASGAAAPRAVLLVSVDGLRPDYVTQADRHGAEVPNLRRMMREGAYAAGVRGVLPSVTYPSHTALVTGVAPARHGIDNNHPFDPAFKNPDAWFWYAEDIRVPTLWDAAAHAGYVTGSISWPVTVGARGIRYNLPEYAGTRSPEDLKMVRALAGPALMDELGAKAGSYLTDVRQAVPRDWARTRYAVEMIRLKHTRFLTVHLAALDHTQHEEGPFSRRALDVVREIDRMLGAMADAIRSEDPRAAVCVVSDHGFARVDHVLELNIPFVKAGLITPRSQRGSLEAAGVADWKAMPWSGSGSAAIVLRDVTDEATRGKVRDLLRTLASDPGNGIVRILEREQIAKMGGSPAAAFWVDVRPGFSIGASLDGPLVEAVKERGTHGYTPDHAEMNASFFLSGDGIRKHLNLGEIDMRDVAPTVASVLGVPFPSAGRAPLPVLDARP